MRMGWLVALLVAGGLAAGFGVGLTGPGHAADPARPVRPWNEIFLPSGQDKGNTMCVDAPGGTSAPGTQLQLYHCHGYAADGAAQRWHFPGGRLSAVSNSASGLCIGFPAGRVPVNGARLVQERCDQVPGRQLVPQGRGGTDSAFVLETSGPGGPALCMAAADLSGNIPTPLLAAPCQGFGNAAEILGLG